MKKLDKTVKKECLYIAVWVLALSAVMQIVFAVLHYWDYTVLLGNLLGGVCAVGNFLGMGITVQNAVERDEKGAKELLRFSRSIRTFCCVVCLIVGIVAPIFHTVAAILPLFFPRLAICFRPLFDRNKETPVGGDENE